MNGAATATGGGVTSGTGAAATATDVVTSPYSASSSANATGGGGSTPGASTATATAIGDSASDNSISANATASSWNGTVGGKAIATAIDTSIGTINGTAVARATGAVSGSSSAQSTAESSVSAPADTAVANASAPAFKSGVATWTQANVSGSWFGTVGTGNNGYAAYAGAMGLPTAGVVSSILTTNVAASLKSSGSTVFGAGVLGTNYSTASTGTITYTASNTQNYNLTGSNAVTLGLLGINSYGGASPFTSLTFTVQNGATSLVSKTFTTLTAAQTYFNDDPLALGNLVGAVSLKETISVTEKTAGGIGVSYVVADPLVVAAPLTSSAAHLASLRAAVGPHAWTLAESDRRYASAAALWRFDSAESGGRNVKTRPLVRIPEMKNLQKIIGSRR